MAIGVLKRSVCSLKSEHGSVSGALLPHVSAAERICAEMPPCSSLLRQTLLKEEGLLCANGQKSKGWICIFLRPLMIVIEMIWEKGMMWKRLHSS